MVSCENFAQSTRKNGKKKLNCFMTHNPLTLEHPFYETKLINKFYSIRRDQEKNSKKKIIISAKSSSTVDDQVVGLVMTKKKKNSINSSTVRAFAARTFLFAFLRSFNVLQTHRLRSSPPHRIDVVEAEI